MSRIGDEWAAIIEQWRPAYRRAEGRGLGLAKLLREAKDDDRIIAMPEPETTFWEWLCQTWTDCWKISTTITPSRTSPRKSRTCPCEECQREGSGR